MKNIRYFYASLMALITLVILFGNNILQDTMEYVSAFGDYPAVSVTGGSIALSTGYNHTCALEASGTVLCWGQNNNGQLGNNSTSNSNIPVYVQNLTGVTSISAGGYFSCALKSNGTVMCWGENLYGQLGNNSNTGSSIPVQVSSLTGVTSISAGGYHACAMKNNGSLVCWGDISRGLQTNAPITISGLSGVSSISSGNGHTCALKSDGTVMCWGYGGVGTLGNGSTNDSDSPVVVSFLSGVTSIGAGAMHTCALKSDGTVMCWGYNYDGQLGNNSTTHSSLPVSVQNLTGVLSIGVGNSRSCAIKDSTIIKCWGEGTQGELGNNTNSSSSVPVSVLNTSGIISIQGGSDHTCMLKNDGSIMCWGGNAYSQLGDGTSVISQLIPTSYAISPSGTGNLFLFSTGSSSGVNGSCSGLPNNAAYYNSGTSYTLVNAASGTSLTGSYASNPAQNTCQFNCTSGYSWNGNSCISTGTGAPTIVTPVGTINTKTPLFTGSGGSGAMYILIATSTGDIVATGSVINGSYSLSPQITQLNEGLNTFIVGGFNSEGNYNGSVTGTVIVDTIAPSIPTIQSHASGVVLNTQSITFTGTAESNSIVRVAIPSGNTYSGVTSGSGNWSIATTLPVGTSIPVFTAVDSVGNTSTGTSLTLTVSGVTDTTAPNAPLISYPINTATFTGASITMSGTAESLSSINIYQGASLLGSTQTNTSNIWSTSILLPTGQTTLTVYATDAAGNTSLGSNIILTYSTGSSFSGITISNPLNNSTYTYNTLVAAGYGTPGNTLVVSTATGTFTSTIDSGGYWSVQLGLTSGTNQFTFYERNTLGVLSSGVSRTVTYSQASGGVGGSTSVGGSAAVSLGTTGMSTTGTDTTIDPVQTVENTGNESVLSNGDVLTPIGSYIPAKNDPGVRDKGRLEQIPSPTVCALDEHVPLNQIITKDIKGSWAEGYIRTLIRFWVVKNTEHFDPSGSITRGEFLSLIVRSLRCNYELSELDSAVTTSFIDVPQNHWVNKYLALAEQYEWLPESLESRFRPDIFITRAEAIEMAGSATWLSDTEDTEGFRDIAYLSAAIQDAVVTAQKYDIIHGIRRLSHWYFYPNTPLTRAEAAKIIQRTFVR